MALTYTPQSNTKMAMPQFTLPTVKQNPVEQNSFSSNELKGKVAVILFICNHCPYVRAIEDRIIKLSKEFEQEKVQFVGICSNDSSDYPEDRPQELLNRWKEKNYDFPYLVDEDQSVAIAFSAVCTPDIFVFSPEGQLYYRGRFDDSWRDESKVQSQDLKRAIQSCLQSKPLDFSSVPSMGCSIKWKSDV